jgi:hypothetical protein
MSYTDRSSRPEERLVCRERLHFIIYVPSLAGIFLGVLLILLGLNNAFSVPPMFLWGFGLLVLIAGIGSLLDRSIERWMTEIAVTSERIVYKTGLIRRDTIEMNLHQVESVVVHQSISGRLFGFGTIVIRGTGQGIQPLHKIGHPLQLRRSILEAAALTVG